MQAQIQKWGNSLGVRIPASVAKELDIKNGSLAQIDVKDGFIVIKFPKKYNLEEMLEQITPENSRKLEWERGDGLV